MTVPSGWDEEYLPERLMECEHALRKVLSKVRFRLLNSIDVWTNIDVQEFKRKKWCKFYVQVVMWVKLENGLRVTGSQEQESICISGTESSLWVVNSHTEEP